MNDDTKASRCIRCGSDTKTGGLNWITGRCFPCERQVTDIEFLMRQPSTRPMTSHELDALVAKEGRVRGVF